MGPDSHHALVIPISDGYAVSCACGWIGGEHSDPLLAEQEARKHEGNPAEDRLQPTRINR
jgi:hypothetical protein